MHASRLASRVALLERWRSFASVSALVAVVAMSLGASCHHRTPDASAPVCPDPPEELLEVPLPEAWEFWLMYEYEPFCDGLSRAADL